MKKLLLLVAFLSVGLAYQSATAQVRISVNINTRPAWAPVDYVSADNYYFPEYDMYYDVRARQYNYMDRGRWVCAPSVPVFYRNVDLARARRVVIHERNPYLRNDYWRGRYYKDAGRGYDNNRGRDDHYNNRHDDHRDNHDNRNNDNRGHDRRH